MDLENAYVNLPAEKSVIGAWLSDEACLKTVRRFEDTDFTDPALRSIFKAVYALVNKNSPVDLVTLDTQSREMGLGDLIEAALDAINETPITLNHQHHVEAVKYCAIRRRIAVGLNATIRKFNNPEVSNDECLTDIRDLLSGATSASLRSGLVHIKPILSEVYEILEMRASGKSNSISTGYMELDYSTGGLFPGEVTVIAARPGVGKSAFAQSLAINAAGEGKKVGIYSLEMPKAQFVERILSRLSGVNGIHLRKGKLSTEDWKLIANGVVLASSKDIYICDSLRKVEDIYEDAINQKEKEGLDMVIIDYVQLCETRKKTVSRYEVVSLVSRMLKELAIKLAVPVIMLAQVKRVDSRVAVMPILSDLKDSGSIEQDADTVFFLHRPDVQDDPSIVDKQRFLSCKQRGDNYIVLNIAKARQGEVGYLEFVFNSRQMLFSEMQKIKEA